MNLNYFIFLLSYMSVMKYKLFLLLIIFSGQFVFGQQSVNTIVPFTPEIVAVRSKPIVSYELYVVNSGRETIRIKRLRVFDNDSLPLFSVDGDNWKKHAKHVDTKSPWSDIVFPSDSVIVYLDFSLSKSTKQLIHQFEYEVKGQVILISKSVSVKKNSVMIGAPLKNGPWAAVYNPMWERGHRRVTYTVNGKSRIPGRYAIDFIQLNDEGKLAYGDDNVIRNWFGYSADVIAVKDGTVLSIKNDFPESATLKEHPAYPADKATGNFISIDIGYGNIAFYEHLKPGSVKVKAGQKVKKGEVIASLGFTGQTTGPHLHFHVANANSALGAEGVPFEFEKFTLLGTYADFDEFGKSPWILLKPGDQSLINKERPESNSVIRF
jgi:murein DD-endopeptidase